jgi:radical SAM superfamily enzyme YgiQ (UPF0313 family)
MTVTAPAICLPRKRLLLVARYYSIEPLGILYLTGLVRDAGWECKVLLIDLSDFAPLYEAVKNWKPDMVGFQIWTGYHIPAFLACDVVRDMGVPVIIGGPHATYFGNECAKHADFVVKGGGFGLLRQILEGTLSSGVHFETVGREEHFPHPDRAVVYDAYPELGASPIKSLFSSVGCPFTCTYCYAPTFNDMHGGFKLTMRPVGDIIAEAREVRDRWPTRMFYFQDDIWGYEKRWLEEFALRWPQEVDIPFHVQIRLELTRHKGGDQRLDLFVEAGCSGISLAIESGNDFLRDHVLFRHMPGELIEEGCKKIMERGMTLRTEQILAVPFSDTTTDLATLGLNNRINPTMMWTSILAPYGGTDMGRIAENFGLYSGNNDDLAESFFDRSVLRHVAGGPRDIEKIVQKLGSGPKDRALLALKAIPNTESGVADIVHKEHGVVGNIEYLDQSANAQYCADVVRLQRLSNFLAKVPDAEGLGRRIVAIPETEWTWKRIGRETTEHLRISKQGPWFEMLCGELARQMGLNSGEKLPEPIAQNPYYFGFFPAGGVLAKSALEKGIFKPEHTTAQLLDELGTVARRHLFTYGLYKIEKGKDPIAA